MLLWMVVVLNAAFIANGDNNTTTTETTKSENARNQPEITVNEAINDTNTGRDDANEEKDLTRRLGDVLVDVYDFEEDMPLHLDHLADRHKCRLNKTGSANPYNSISDYTYYYFDRDGEDHDPDDGVGAKNAVNALPANNLPSNTNLQKEGKIKKKALWERPKFINKFLNLLLSSSHTFKNNRTKRSIPEKDALNVTTDNPCKKYLKTLLDNLTSKNKTNLSGEAADLKNVIQNPSLLKSLYEKLDEKESIRSKSLTGHMIRKIIKNIAHATKQPKDPSFKRIAEILGSFLREDIVNPLNSPCEKFKIRQLINRVKKAYKIYLLEKKKCIANHGRKRRNLNPEENQSIESEFLPIGINEYMTEDNSNHDAEAEQREIRWPRPSRKSICKQRALKPLKKVLAKILISFIMKYDKRCEGMAGYHGKRFSNKHMLFKQFHKSVPIKYDGFGHETVHHDNIDNEPKPYPIVADTYDNVHDYNNEPIIDDTYDNLHIIADDYNNVPIIAYDNIPNSYNIGQTVYQSALNTYDNAPNTYDTRYNIYNNGYDTYKLAPDTASQASGYATLPNRVITAEKIPADFDLLRLPIKEISGFSSKKSPNKISFDYLSVDNADDMFYRPKKPSEFLKDNNKAFEEYSKNLEKLIQEFQHSPDTKNTFKLNDISNFMQQQYELDRAHNPKFKKNNQSRVTLHNPISDDDKNNHNSVRTQPENENGIPHVVPKDNKNGFLYELDLSELQKSSYGDAMANLGPSPSVELPFSENNGEIELTYIVRQPKVIVYQPQFLVKHRMSTGTYIKNIKEIFNETTLSEKSLLQLLRVTKVLSLNNTKILYQSNKVNGPFQIMNVSQLIVNEDILDKSSRRSYDNVHLTNMSEKNISNIIVEAEKVENVTNNNENNSTDDKNILRSNTPVDTRKYENKLTIETAKVNYYSTTPIPIITVETKLSASTEPMSVIKVNNTVIGVTTKENRTNPLPDTTETWVKPTVLHHVRA